MRTEPETLPPVARDELVATFTVAMQLDDIALRQRQREADGRRRGVAAAFAGVAGTGKTLAAQVLAGMLNRPLRWLAATAPPATLDRQFAAAAADGTILLLEARDLLGPEGGVAQRRWLQQRIETHPGVVILETGVAAHLATDFLRRFDVVIEFNLPDAGMRRRIAARGFRPR